MFIKFFNNTVFPNKTFFTHRWIVLNAYKERRRDIEIQTALHFLCTLCFL